MIVSSVLILLAALGLLTAGIYTDSNSYLYSSIAASLLAGVALFFGARSRACRNEEAAIKAREKARSVSKRRVSKSIGSERDGSKPAVRSDGSSPSRWRESVPQSRDTVTEEFTRINDAVPPYGHGLSDGQGLPPRTDGVDSSGRLPANNSLNNSVPSQRLSTASPPNRNSHLADPDSFPPHTPSHGTRVPPNLPPPGEWPPLDSPPPPPSEPRSQWDHWEEAAPETGTHPTPPSETVDRFAALTENHPVIGSEPSGRHSQVRAGSTGEFEQLRSDIAQWSEAANEAANWDEGPRGEPSARELNSIEAAQLMRLEAVVQVIDGRPRFHLDDCTHLTGRDYEPLDLNEAIELGFSPCGLCDPVAHFSAAPALS